MDMYECKGEFSAHIAQDPIRLAMDGVELRRRIFAAAVTAAVLLSGLAAVASTPSEESGLQPVDGGSTRELSTAELEDLAWIAERDGTTLEEQIRIRGWKTPVVEALGELASGYPDDFAGAVIRTGVEREVFLAFKGQPPEALFADARLVDVSLEIRTDTGYSEAEMVEEVVALHYLMLESGTFGDRISSGHDVETGVLHILIEIPSTLTVDDETFSPPSEDQLIASLPASVRDRSNTVVEFVDALPMADAALGYGGGRIDTTHICTAGFKMKITISPTNKSMLTAGHCPGSTGNHRNLPGSPAMAVFMNTAHNGQYGDFRTYFFASPNEPSRQFYHDHGLLRTPNAVLTPAAGADVCRFGRTTGKHCDEIYRINQCQSQTCRLSVNLSSSSQGGDSGGPIYWNNGIYGITKGYNYYLPAKWIKRDTWSALINTNLAISETADLGAP